MYKKAIYPGSFDPITNGHLDIIKRAAKMHNELIVAVLNNSQKKSLFTPDERCDMIREALKDEKNVTVDSFSGLLVDYCKKQNTFKVIRGLRAITDFENEMQLANLNKSLFPELETVFLCTSTKYSYLSSTMVKEIASFGGDINEFVPEIVKNNLKIKYGV